MGMNGIPIRSYKGMQMESGQQIKIHYQNADLNCIYYSNSFYSRFIKPLLFKFIPSFILNKRNCKRGEPIRGLLQHRLF